MEAEKGKKENYSWVQWARPKTLEIMEEQQKKIYKLKRKLAVPGHSITSYYSLVTTEWYHGNVYIIT